MEVVNIGFDMESMYDSNCMLKKWQCCVVHWNDYDNIIILVKKCSYKHNYCNKKMCL